MFQANNTWPTVWTAEHEKLFASIAKASYPNEAVAILVDGDLIELINMSNDPTNMFKVDIPTIYLDKISAIIHSHPDATYVPSKADMDLYVELDIPFGIMPIGEDNTNISIWLGNHLCSLDLEGREFIHGILDCYNLIRSYYYQTQGIYLKDYPRADDWWYSGEDLYSNNFIDCGFYEVGEPNIGDVVLMAINSKVINHAGIYIGDDTIIHHLYNRLSKKDNFSMWAKHVKKIVRYTNA